MRAPRGLAVLILESASPTGSDLAFAIRRFLAGGSSDLSLRRVSSDILELTCCFHPEGKKRSMPDQQSKCLLTVAAWSF